MAELLPNRAADAPKGQGTIGVVIPGYGHPQFLSEAIISACTQEIDQPLQVVVVDDGCRFPETGKVVTNLMERFPGMLYYLRQENTRLPGARNAGVRFLMSMVPDLDAVFFLDADNRLSPYSLQRYREVLGDDPLVGWAYPDISFMGLTWGEEGFDTRETAPDYSKLKHLVGNISEAGSLVRADMLRQGVLFDETMRYGFEDWDFWLTALDAGYVGRRVQHAGFLYRRRPESMLADSRRQEDELISKMRRKHAALFKPRNVMALEHREAPYFALVLAGTGDILLTSDPQADGHCLTREEFVALVRRWHHNRREFFFPDSLIILTQEQWDQMKAQPQYLRWLFWAVKEQPGNYHRWLFEARPRPYFEGLPADTPDMVNSILHVSAEGFSDLLRDAASDDEAGPVEFAPAVFQTPEPLVSGQTAPRYQSLFASLETLVEEAAPKRPRVRHAGRRFAGPGAAACRLNLVDEVCAEEGRKPFPVATGTKRTLVAVDQDILANKAKCSRFVWLLEQLREAAEEVLLVIERGKKQDLAGLHPETWLPLVSDMVMLDRVPSGLEYRIYLGRRIYSLFTLKSKEDGAILARSVDRVITVGAAAFLEVLGDARQHGVKGYVFFDSIFADAGPLDSEDSAKILAFEHAEELVVCDNDEMVRALAAQGFPPAKFIGPQNFFDMLQNQ
ncbi:MULTISPECIES: glycosyltransferase family A protein [Kordiimonas]|jgi:glycosyltransferase involved in cell wall biosynthesis|uniref:glycosyltransferase family A protein n=1 Tax=Kordiimonas TaxID=288021 RepID=UPI00257BE5E0|nr:glycosyltransferase family A protein [Kordiimonas sp. UBA4487]